MELIVDPNDERLGDFRQLNRPLKRREVEEAGQGFFIVEGTLALEQLLKSQHRVRSLLITPNRTERLSEQISLLESRGAQILVADRNVVESAAGFDVHRGVLASADRPSPPPVEQLLEASNRVAVLEGVNDHENLGSIFRNSAALGIDAVLLDPTTADPYYRRSIRVSLGWALRVPSTRMGTLRNGIQMLKDNGFTVVALTPAGDALEVDQASAAGLLDDRVAFLVGAEGPGLSEAALAAADARVRIPMVPGVDSLNVATSLAVVAAFAGDRRNWQ